MSLQLRVLGSGSSGNCSLIRCPEGDVLIDIGISPLAARRRIGEHAKGTGKLRAVLLTHLDSDHFSPAWSRPLAAAGVPVFCHNDRVEEAREIAPELSVLLKGFDDRGFSLPAGLSIKPIHLAHDQEGSHGFVIEGFGGRIGYATDLGRVSRRLIEAFCELDILAIESNYDPQMQVQSARPWFLKKRIMGGRGHLSNAQALEAVREIYDRCERGGRRTPGHVVLLHRSRECNCPVLLRTLFSSDARISAGLTLAEAFKATPWLYAAGSPRVQEQLVLAFG